MLNLERLRAFVVFSEHLSLTRAAESLHVSQPALHAQISKLSEELGVVLYIRRGRRLELTAEGVRTAAFGREILERSQSFMQELGLRVPTQPVVLAAGAGAYLHLLGPAIHAFVKSDVAPLRLLTHNREQTVDAVTSGLAHVGVTAGELPAHDLESTRLVTVPQVLVMPKAHRLARRSVRLRDLDGERLVVPPPDSEHRRNIADVLRDAEVRWEVAVEASGWELMMHFVALGLGVAIVNGICRLPRGLVKRPIPALPKRTYWLLQRARATERPSAAALARAICDNLG